MACKYCGETDPIKLMMSTRMINGKALSFDVCFSCSWREKFEAEVMGNMKHGKILRSPDWKGIYKDRKFLELLGRFNSTGQPAICNDKPVFKRPKS
jgi:hypothetical protein